MKLWKVARTDEWSYDDYDALIVAAVDEASARMTTPDGVPIDADAGLGSSWVNSPDLLTVEYIGDARPGTAAGVVLASFNAG